MGPEDLGLSHPKLSTRFPALRVGGYRSGQTGQTVTLLAMPSQVRILFLPPFSFCSQLPIEKVLLTKQNFMSDNSSEKKAPPDPLVVAVAEHDGNLAMGVRAIARRVETNEDAETNLLFIRYNVRVGDEGFKLLGQLEHLEVLDATDCALTNKGLKSIGELTRLRELILDITEVGDDGLAHLSKMECLSRLSLSATRVTDVGLQHLTNMHNLQSLNLSNTSVTHRGLRHLKNLYNLTHLDLGENNIRDDGVEHLSKLVNLESLTLNYNRISDEGAKWLKGYDFLKFLNIKGNFITDRMVADLIESMPQATINR